MNPRLLLAATLLAGLVATPSLSEVRRETAERRPYIVEIGYPSEIEQPVLNDQARKISQLREYIDLYGYPDYAEVQELSPAWPWEPYEVRLYYLRRNLEVDFGHVLLSEAMKDFGLIKFQGDIEPNKRRQIEIILEARQAPPPAPSTLSEPAEIPAAPIAPAAVVPAEQLSPEQPQAGGLTETLVARIEAAAERAAQAADQAAVQSEAAARAADRTVKLVEEIEQTLAAQ